MIVPPIEVAEQLAALGGELRANKSPSLLVWGKMDFLQVGSFEGKVTGSREEVAIMIAQVVVSIARRDKVSPGKILSEILDVIEKGR